MTIDERTFRILATHQFLQWQIQTEETNLLIEKASVFIPDTGCGIRKIKKFQKYFIDLNVAIVVYFSQAFAAGGKPFFDGADKFEKQGKIPDKTIRVMYFEKNQHYRPILNMIGASGSRKFCEFCNIGYNHDAHKCEKFFISPRCFSRNESIICQYCGQNFDNLSCCDSHKNVPSPISKDKLVCQLVKLCKNYHKMDLLYLPKKLGQQCGYTYCKICCEKKPNNHFLSYEAAKKQTSIIK